jgi:hypothetical protein
VHFVDVNVTGTDFNATAQMEYLEREGEGWSYREDYLAGRKKKDKNGGAV